jgi:hypothetical protein
MSKLLNNPALSATIFVPEDTGVIAAGSAAASADAVMYNMLHGNWCPDELVAAGSKNSMLGEVRGKEFPLIFSNDTTTGDLLITGPLGTARVLNVSIACNNIIYTTDVPLLPPPAATTRGAANATPQTLPEATVRHMTCRQRVYNEIAVNPPDPSKNPAIPLEAAAQKAAESANNGGGTVTDGDGDSNSSNNTALAIGLGVGIGCAVLLGGALGFVIAKRRRVGQKNTVNNENKLLASGSSDMGTGAKLLPGQSMADTSVLYNKSSLNRVSYGLYQASADGTGTGTATFASVSDILCDSAMVLHDNVAGSTSNYATPVGTTDTKISSPTSSTARGAAGESTNGSNAQMNRLGSVDRNGTGVDLWEVNPSDLQIALDISGHPIELGKGSYGTVYRGSIRQVQPAAIKVMNENLGLEASAAFWREAAILKHASRDRNIVQFYGTSTLPDGKFLLITELMERGDLREALTSKKTKDELVWSRKGKNIALDIARGVTALHAINVIHRDLKSKNVLLTENLTAKVADVGIAGVHSQGYLTAGAGHAFGTLAWSAPELLLGERCSEKVDIYSLGVIIWEIATKGQVPKRGSVQPPSPSKDCPAQLSLLIEDCIKPEPAARPTAKQIYERLLEVPR